MADGYIPQAIFDSPELIDVRRAPAHVPSSFHEDYYQAARFLLSYQYNAQTFKSYRREVERLLQWAWFIAKTPTNKLKREDIENYLLFCRNPPSAWIGLKNVARFTEQEGLNVPNPEWKPFVAGVSKAERQQGKLAKVSQYNLSEKGFREIFTILNCVYNFFIQENYTDINPIAQIRQKSRFYRKTQGKTKIRRISVLQWDFVIETAEQMAQADPAKHERTLFIISVLYGMYLRVSELAASERWVPKMSDFSKDHDGNWWFTTVGKGNKERQVAVSDDILKSLARWRAYLGQSPALPSPADQSPLVPLLTNLHQPVTDTRHVRRIVQACFDAAVARMKTEGFQYEAEVLAEATVHWLRHTGISEDVKFRPREHVRDDAGHSSSSITDKYIDVDLQERHASAQKKHLK